MCSESEQSSNIESILNCDVCGKSLVSAEGCGVLHANWGEESSHRGEKYKVCLCETCFFVTLAALRRERTLNKIFDEDVVFSESEFGLVKL